MMERVQTRLVMACSGVIVPRPTLW